MAQLTLTDIRKSFDGNDILKGISLDIADGEFLSLVGESGCGKSTLLRIISGLETPDSGQIEIGGKPVTDLAPKARGIAMVFQDYALYPHMSVAQNMAMPLIMSQLPLYARMPGAKWVTPNFRPLRSEMAGQVDRIARQLRIDHLLERRPAQLSGGQRQRVALGRALVRNPSVFLMDEPLSNLDAKLRVEVRGEIVELHRASGLTFVYVTHDQTEAMTMSDRVALLQTGTLLQVAPPALLYAEPDSVEVARFIGSPEINLIPARTEARGVRLGQTLLDLPHDRPVGEDLMLGLRPEALDPAHPGIATAPVQGPRLSLDVTLSTVEDLGGEVILHTRLAESPDIAIRIRGQKTLGAGPQAISLPQRFSVTFPEGAVQIFGADGRRIPVAAPARPVGTTAVHEAVQ